MQSADMDVPGILCISPLLLPVPIPMKDIKPEQMPSLATMGITPDGNGAAGANAAYAKHHHLGPIVIREKRTVVDLEILVVN